MNTQPEALRLADELITTLFESTRWEAAAELRRLHARNQELLKALKFVGKQMHNARDAKTKADYSVVLAAIAKAEAA